MTEVSYLNGLPCRGRRRNGLPYQGPEARAGRGGTVAATAESV